MALNRTIDEVEEESQESLIFRGASEASEVVRS